MTLTESCLKKKSLEISNSSFHTSCIICKSPDLKELKDYQKASLCKCQNCGCVFSIKIPSRKELENHYNKYGRRDYLSPITIKRYNELLDKFEKYRKTNKIIDVGCGIGYFLEEAKKRGWDVHGTEYTDEAIKICSDKGINVRKGPLEQIHYNNEMFDIITSFEVIEHISNPSNELNTFNSILRTGGLVYITTPNFNSLLRYHLKSEYNIIAYPEHLSYYTPKTLSEAFKRSGFTKLKIETTGISLTRFKTSKGKSKQRLISATSDDELIRNKIDRSWYLPYAKKIINTVLSILGKGDSLKGWFIKK